MNQSLGGHFKAIFFLSGSKYNNMKHDKKQFLVNAMSS